MNRKLNAFEEARLFTVGDEIYDRLVEQVQKALADADENVHKNRSPSSKTVAVAGLGMTLVAATQRAAEDMERFGFKTHKT